MAKLAYCEVCKATYPLVIVSGDTGRSQRDRAKNRPLTCPLGHTKIRKVDEAPTGEK